MKSMPQFVWFCRFPHMQIDLNFTVFVSFQFFFVSFPVKLHTMRLNYIFRITNCFFQCTKPERKTQSWQRIDLLSNTKRAQTAAFFELIELFIYTWHASLCQVRFSLYLLAVFAAIIRVETQKTFFLEEVSAFAFLCRPEKLIAKWKLIAFARSEHRNQSLSFSLNFKTLKQTNHKRVFSFHAMLVLHHLCWWHEPKKRKKSSRKQFIS